MKTILSDSTNCSAMKSKKNTRNYLINKLKQKIQKIEDSALVYDIQECIKVLKNEDLEVIKDLKNALVEVCEENEELFKEKADLVVQNEYLKEMLKNNESVE